ncbi:hypothetical protein [Enterococcus gallinarum]|uniref:hypothetical protein n=1 Tax=Enterococcus gallinarum TaxID=1353 RepID=UPI000A5BC563|nr:hypothetical protein [Enterococcus gallinarum]
MTSVVREVMGSGFDGILVIASNPVDVLTHVAWQAIGSAKQPRRWNWDNARYHQNSVKNWRPKIRD